MTANDSHAEYDLETLWAKYHARLQAFVQSRISDPATAEDILQEVFIRVHRQLCCQPEWNRPDGWFYQIARNLIIDYYRRRRELVELPDGLPPPPICQKKTRQPNWRSH